MDPHAVPASAQQRYLDLVTDIERRLSELPPYEWRDTAAEGRYREAVERLSGDLQSLYSARFGRAGDAETISMAGLRSSATGGRTSLIRNWCTAARRELARLSK